LRFIGEPPFWVAGGKGDLVTADWSLPTASQSSSLVNTG